MLAQTRENKLLGNFDRACSKATFCCCYPPPPAIREHSCYQEHIFIFILSHDSCMNTLLNPAGVDAVTEEMQGQMERKVKRLKEECVREGKK